MPAARPSSRVTRRTVVVAGGLAAGLVTAGCGEQPGRPDPGPAAQAEGDEAVLAAVRTELAAAYALVAGTVDRHRSLRGVLGELQATRAAQLETLTPDGGADLPEPDVARDPVVALARVRASEERLQRRLLTWAVAVDSGPLARVLAAASAGTAQHRVLLDRLPDREGPA